jgi:23S rRNA pseudouridine1911/1915/1917 synthase
MNKGYLYRDEVAGECDGLSVLDFYATRYTNASRVEWARRIARGQVRRNGQVVAADAALRAGDRLDYERPPWQEPAVPTDMPVVFEDDDLLAVDKPAGLPVLPAGGFLENTAVWLLRRKRPEAQDWSPVHCLDRGTSGLLLFGKTHEALSALGRDLKERRVKRVYLAVLAGIIERDEFSVGTPIGPEPHPHLGPVHVASESGKAARTDFAVLDRDAESNTSLVRATPHTGRTHQIRIHAAVAGHSLAGERFFVAGGRWDEDAAKPPTGFPRPGEGGFRLHAWRLTLRHPCGGRVVELLCPPPADFWPHPFPDGVS